MISQGSEVEEGSVHRFLSIVCLFKCDVGTQFLVHDHPMHSSGPLSSVSLCCEIETYRTIIC